MNPQIWNFLSKKSLINNHYNCDIGVRESRKQVETSLVKSLSINISIHICFSENTKIDNFS